MLPVDTQNIRWGIKMLCVFNVTLYGLRDFFQATSSSRYVN